VKRYDPKKSLDAEAWLALEEGERHELVRLYHRRNGIRVPNMTLHVVAHVIVENQLAERLPPVLDAMERLGSSGLDRHDAVHAVASVVMEHLSNLLKEKRRPEGDPNAAYYAALEQLTAASWRSLA
jgi:hypothetical protein